MYLYFQGRRTPLRNHTAQRTQQVALFIQTQTLPQGGTDTIQRIESGQKPGLESLKCLAAVFETSISTLAQEQAVTEQNVPDPTENIMLMQIEREAIEFDQSILNGPKKGSNDPLSKIERQAIDYAKKLVAKFAP